MSDTPQIEVKAEDRQVSATLVEGEDGVMQITRVADSRSQKFFADLWRAARSPGYGDQERTFVKNLLLRAQEAQLYAPEAA